jgi:two-component system sensor histidine kinase/response regulator
MKGDRERCLAAGMDAYVAKPLRPDELFKAMATVLEESRNGCAETDKPLLEPAASQVFDADAALARVEGDMELFQNMAQLFANQSGKLLADMADAANCGDTDRLERSAHKLKGSIGNFAAHGAYQTAHEIEDKARAGTCAGLQETCSKLGHQIETLHSALADFTKEKVSCAS